MLTFLSRELRAWRIMHASSNRLVRPMDRLETTLLLVLSLVALLGLLVALTVGGDTYATSLARLDDQAPRHSVSAKVISVATQGDDATVVAWRNPAGHQVTETVDREELDRVGRTRVLWLDASGTLTEPPETVADAVMRGIGSGGAVAVVCALGWWVSTWIVRTLTDRHRARLWDRQWRDLDIDSHR